MRQRQAEGIRMAKLRGVRFGRPKALDPANLEEIIDGYLKGKITGKEACEKSGLSRGTFFRRVKSI